MTFPTEILGIVTNMLRLVQSDGAAGAPGTLYTSGTIRNFGHDGFNISPDLRTLTADVTQIFNISQARIITAAPNLPLVTSTFDAGDEGWQLVRDGVAETPTYAGSGGNAGGQITTVTDSGTRVVWRAPAAFLGDLSAAYNGYLKFDLRAPTGGTAIVDNIDVLMQGGGLEMRFDRAYDPDTGWTRFVLPLYEGGDWRLTGAAANSQPSQAHFQTILANLTNIEIRAKYNDAPGTAGLDNVEIARLDPNPVMAGVFTSPAGNFSALNQNPDGTYTPAADQRHGRRLRQRRAHDQCRRPQRQHDGLRLQRQPPAHHDHRPCRQGHDPGLRRRR